MDEILEKQINDFVENEFQKNATPPPTEPADIAKAIGLALNLTYEQNSEYSNPFNCPFCGLVDSARWNRFEYHLKCSGCKPSESDVSKRHSTYGYVDTGLKLKIISEYSEILSDFQPIKSNSDNSSAASFLERNKFYQKLPISVLLALLDNIPAHFDKIKSRGPKPKLYCLCDIEALIDQCPEELNFLVLTDKELSTPQLYKAAAHRPIEEGQYARREMARTVNVSWRTSRKYDKLSETVVIQNISRQPLSEADSKRFLALDRGSFGGAWIEAVGTSERFRPTQEGFRAARATSIRFCGRSYAELCIPQKNTYIPKPRNSEAIGLPVEFRRYLIRYRLPNLARLVDCLLLAGVQPTQKLTAKQIIELAPQIPPAEIYRVLKSISDKAEKAA